MSTQQYPRPGIGNTNSYLVSGYPFITGAVMASGSFATNNGQVRITFPYVARTVTVINRSAVDLRVHFASVLSGNVISGRHYITLSEQRDSATFNVKCRDVYISLASGSADGEFELFAELTNILSGEMMILTGSGITA